MANYTEKELTDILEVNGVNAKGYGIVPKIVMQDTRLTIQSKAIYAYFCSYAGAGTQAFPSQRKIMYDLGIGSAKTLKKHLNLLNQYGYIKIKQTRKSDGTFNNNIYTLVTNPKCKTSQSLIESDSKPIGNNCPTDKKEEEIPQGKNYGTVKKPYRQNYGNNNNSNIKLTDNINNQSINHETNKKKIDGLIDNKLMYKIEQKEIDKKIKELELSNVYPDLVVQAITDALNYIYRANKSIGTFHHTKETRQKLFKNIDIEIINTATYQFAQAENVKNSIAYLSSCIYNALYQKNADKLNIQNQINKMTNLNN